MKSIIHLTCYTVLLLLIPACSTPETNEVQERPNIILILADDMGWSDLGCYGSEINTPNIDRLAAEGMRFRNFYNTSKCHPSRAALLTGVYAQDCGYGRQHNEPIRNAVTLGEVLRTAGYSTYMTGKHHGVENPYERGFDRYYGLVDGAFNHFNPGKQREGEAVPAQKRRDRNWAIDSVRYSPYTPQEKDFYSTDYFTNYAIQYLEQHQGREQPFFLYIAYNSPHDPLMAWPEDISKYKGRYDKGYEAVRQSRYQKQLKTGLLDSMYLLSEPTYRPWESLEDQEREFEARKMEVYAAMVDRIDQNIGRLLDKLRDLGYDENTLILFVSDNGASAEVVELDNDDDSAPIGSMARWISLKEDWANVANTPFRYYKNDSYEGGINTPCIAWWPDHVKPNTFSDYPGHFIDFMATFTELTGANYPDTFNGESITPLRGVSLLPVFADPDQSRNGPLFWEWRGGQAMRVENWKIVRKTPSDLWDLYDLSSDPTETENVSEMNEARVAQMDSIYQQWISRYN